MKRPLVSIIIPCYNGEAFVADAIASAIAQTWDEIEILVIDDGSTDASRDVIAAFGDKVRVIATANRGGGAARNTGIEAACGEFIQLLDCDDVLLPDCVAAKMHTPFEPGECPVCDWRNISEDGVGQQVRHADLDGDPIAAQLRTQMVTSAPLHRRDDLVEIGGFDESLSCSQERDLHLRLACDGIVFRRLPKVLNEIRRRHGSVSSDYARVLLQHRKIFQRCIDDLQRTGRWNDTLAKGFAQAFARDAQQLMRWEEHRSVAREYFATAQQLSPRGMRAIYAHPLKRTLASLLGPFAVERMVDRIQPQ